jgi:hypothetical protein
LSLPFLFAERFGADGGQDGRIFRLVRGLGTLQHELGGAHLGGGHVGRAEGVMPQAIVQGAVIESGGFAKCVRALASPLPRSSLAPWFRGVGARHGRAIHQFVIAAWGLLGMVGALVR